MSAVLDAPARDSTPVLPADVQYPLEPAALGLDSRVRCYELRPGRAPLFIERVDPRLANAEDFHAWLAATRPTIDRLIVDHGGIVLRGFPVRDTPDFVRLTGEFPQFQSGYAGGRAPRSAIKGHVMESTRLAPSVHLILHSEMAYVRDYPRRIAFYSRVTAPVGGETTIGDMRDLVAAMPAALVEKLQRHGTRMASNYGPRAVSMDATYAHMDLRGWNQAFYTEDPAEVERICAAKGLEPIWNADGSLTVLTPLEPLVEHPITGQRLFRSVIHVPPQAENAELTRELRSRQQYPTGATLGNGEPLSEDELQTLRTLCRERGAAWPWQDGDVMILDNLQVWHGRNPYEGAREVQVALLD
ncbi:hypothetical protein FOZ76_26965 [Verticiella sediminum]|uniref:TauD/TfdA-like domain-containing protein n=1 Tax=Verticiella sediminum TaxID=1247510 RepID=A0A556A6L6_9BURK|nr:TauD/TfdA family dioxygenase [Verticiella sediminum]TSH88518.1 hypothetical protein FOZ76_26965 [Verticiella sediminum]